MKNKIITLALCMMLSSNPAIAKRLSGHHLTKAINEFNAMLDNPIKNLDALKAIIEDLKDSKLPKEVITAHDQLFNAISTFDSITYRNQLLSIQQDLIDYKKQLEQNRALYKVFNKPINATLTTFADSLVSAGAPIGEGEQEQPQKPAALPIAEKPLPSIEKPTPIVERPTPVVIQSQLAEEPELTEELKAYAEKIKDILNVKNTDEFTADGLAQLKIFSAKLKAAGYKKYNEELERAIQGYAQELEKPTLSAPTLAITPTPVIQPPEKEPEIPQILMPYVERVRKVFDKNLKNLTADGLANLKAINAELKAAGHATLAQPLELDRLIEEYAQGLQKTPAPLASSIPPTPAVISSAPTAEQLAEEEQKKAKLKKKADDEAQATRAAAEAAAKHEKKRKAAEEEKKEKDRLERLTTVLEEKRINEERERVAANAAATAAKQEEDRKATELAVATAAAQVERERTEKQQADRNAAELAALKKQADEITAAEMARVAAAKQEEDRKAIEEINRKAVEQLAEEQKTAELNKKTEDEAAAAEARRVVAEIIEAAVNKQEEDRKTAEEQAAASAAATTVQTEYERKEREEADGKAAEKAAFVASIEQLLKELATADMGSSTVNFPVSERIQAFITTVRKALSLSSLEDIKQKIQELYTETENAIFAIKPILLNEKRINGWYNFTQQLQLVMPTLMAAHHTEINQKYQELVSEKKLAEQRAAELVKLKENIRNLLDEYTNIPNLVLRTTLSTPRTNAKQAAKEFLKALEESLTQPDKAALEKAVVTAYTTATRGATDLPKDFDKKISAEAYKNWAELIGKLHELIPAIDTNTLIL